MERRSQISEIKSNSSLQLRLDLETKCVWSQMVETGPTHSRKIGDRTLMSGHKLETKIFDRSQIETQNYFGLWKMELLLILFGRSLHTLDLPLSHSLLAPFPNTLPHHHHFSQASSTQKSSPLLSSSPQGQRYSLHCSISTLPFSSAQTLTWQQSYLLQFDIASSPGHRIQPNSPAFR